MRRIDCADRQQHDGLRFTTAAIENRDGATRGMASPDINAAKRSGLDGRRGEVAKRE
jgi:hypothetical protein